MPNAKVLSEKQAAVAALMEKMKNAGTVVLVDYKGISVADDTKLRRELRAAGVEYAVIKNTMVRFAADALDMKALDEHLNGTTAVAMSEDPLAAAKVLCGFAKKNDKIKVKAGYVEGKPMTAEQIIALSKLPSREVLLAQVLGGLTGTIRALAVALQAIVDKDSEPAA